MMEIEDLDIRQLDLNVLTVFDAMLEHGSVTRAGQALGLSQPAMSAALAKLRAQFDDALFVRTGRGMRPTPRATQLAEPVRRVLETIRAEILRAPAFDPARSERAFTLITPDIGEIALLPRVLAHLEREAPGVTLRSVAMQPSDTAEALESGAADLAVGYFPDLARPGYYQQRLFRNRYVCIVRADHPRFRERITLKQFLGASHAVVRPAGRSHIFERFLEARRLERRVRVDIGHFSSLLTIVAESDLIATVPRDIGEVFAQLANVRLIEPPLQPPRFDVKQHWHQRFHKDPANTWLRQTLWGLLHD